MDKWYFNKIKNYCSDKDTIKPMKRQKYRKYLQTTYLAGKEFIFRT